jgi:hypothetical protein
MFSKIEKILGVSVAITTVWPRISNEDHQLLIGRRRLTALGWRAHPWYQAGMFDLSTM